MLPESNTLPNRMYKAKEILCPMRIEYKKIHACPNDCILYRKVYANLRSCPKGGLSRYKVKNGDQGNTYEVAKHDPPLKTFGIYQ